MLDKNEPFWFESSFQQLPDVGKKQLGAIVGSLIADLAVSGFRQEDYSGDDSEMGKMLASYWKPSSINTSSAHSDRAVTE